MRDDPRKNLKWMQQQLQAVEAPEPLLQEDDDLLRRVDALIGDMAAEEAPAGNFGPGSKGVRAERSRQKLQLEESAAMLTKTKKQLRQEEKQRKIAEKKSGINRNLKDLVFLAVLETVGILYILGWWFQ